MATEGYSKVRSIQLVRDRAVSAYGGLYDSYSETIPCEWCGKWCRPEMHHRRFRSRGGDWRPSNIIALCSECHHQVTTCRDGWSREFGLSVSQFQQPEDVSVPVWYEPDPVLFDNEGGFRTIDDIAND